MTDDLIRTITFPGQRCAYCGLEAVGFATFNGERYCHHRMRDCFRLVCPEQPKATKGRRK